MNSGEREFLRSVMENARADGHLTLGGVLLLAGISFAFAYILIVALIAIL